MRVQQSFFMLIKKSAQISTKVKSLVQLFKGGRFPKGGAIWSSLASDEILLLTNNAIKTKAVKL